MERPASDIRPGDLLLFHGDSFVSWAIRKIDGAPVNHAAIALPGGLLAEAGGSGLTTRPLPTAFSDRDHMLLRQHASGEALDPVVLRAQQYLADGHFYAYQQIVLLAALGLVRRIPARGLARRLIRSALDHAARALMDLLPIGASWMICSEYVYRCYDEAVAAPPDPFGISIAGLTFAADPTAESWADWAEATAAPVSVAPQLGFGPGPMAATPEAIEADLAPLVAEWAIHAGIDPQDPLPVRAVAPAFAAPDPDPAVAEAAQEAEVSDADLHGAMVTFAETLKVARATAPGVPVQFGLASGAIAAAAVKGAVAGLRDLTVDPNFVTPRDLLVSPSFGPADRIASS